MARNGRPRREGGVTNGACPAALPGLAMRVMRVGDGVLPSRRGGDDGRGALCRHSVDPVTCT